MLKYYRVEAIDKRCESVVMKTLKIENVVHEQLTKMGSKNQTYSEIIAELILEEPYASELRDVAERTSVEIEKGKQSGHMPMIIGDELLRVIQKFLKHVENRQKGE